MVGSDSLGTFFSVYGGCVGACIVGAVYFIRARGFQQQPLFRRLAASSYAPATALIFLLGIGLPRELWLSLGRPAWDLLQLLPALLMVYSLVAYPGKRSIHLLLLPAALICWFWQLVIGGLIIFGK